MNDLIRNRTFGVILVAASIIALMLAVYSSYRTRSYAKCQSVVSEALIRASTARAEAFEEDRKADRDESEATAVLIKTVFTSASTAERVAAYDAYRATLDEVNERRAAAAADRAAHPLPEPPSEVCS